MKASELFKNLDKLIPNKLAILVTLVALFVALFPVVIVLAKEFSLSSDDKQRKLYFHSSLCAARVQDNLRQYETFLKTVVLDPQVKDLVTGNLPDSKRASQVLAGTSRHMKAVFPSSLAFLATYESMPYFVPTPPNEFSLGTESQVLAFLAESMPNSFSGQVAFRWSKPFQWNGNTPCVAAVAYYPSKGEVPACIGMVMPLSKLRNDTVEAVFNFSDVSGAVIFNRSDSIPWYPQVISDIEQGAYRPSPGEIKALINRTRDATTGQFFDDVFSQDFCGFYQELGESGLGFVALYSRERLKPSLGSSITSFVFIVIFLLIAGVGVAFLLARRYEKSLADIESALNEHTSDKRVPAPSHDTSEDVAPLIKRLSEFSSELARRDELIEQQMQEYRQTLDKTREVVNSIQDAFVLTDDNGEIVEANETFQKLSGYAPSEAEGKKLLTLLDDTSFSQQQSPASPPTLLLLCKNGDKLPVTMFEKNVTLGGDDYTISLIRDTSREVQLSRAVKEKTSELEAGAVRAHRQVERYKSAQRQLTEQLFEGVLRADEAGNILYGNASAADILNFPTSIELISVNIFDDISFVDVSDNGIRAFFDGGEASFPAKVKFDTLDKKKGSAMVKANWQKEGDKRIAQILIHDTSEYDKLRESITRLREEMDVVLREHENELLISQNKLVAHAHSSGMAHVASEVLHNIGNAVNSINVRLKNISESIEREKLPSRLRRVADLYSENGDGETEQTAAAGYMAALAEAVDKSRQQLIENVNFINEKLDHVSEIISLQQSVASVRGIIEKVNVKDLIVDAMEINREAITKRNIKVRFMFGEVPVIRVEKNKLIQVLVNIIKNAIEAIDSSDSERDEMVVSASYSKKTEMVSIDVKDSGIGMTAEVRANLFKFGFTTKEQGSGFGLHSSYNLIKAMGGTINAQSEGKGKGATFSIELPLMPPLREEAKKEVEWEIADGV